MQRISNEYSFLCKNYNSISSSIKIVSSYPSEVFEDCLYIGNANAAKNESVIQDLGITHILNISDDIPNYFENDAHFSLVYENIIIEDIEEAPINFYFKQAYDFINTALFNDSTEINDEQVEFKNSEDFLNSEISHSHRCDFDTQTLRLDIGKQSYENWSGDELKHAGLHCDINISEMHKSHSNNKLLVH